MLTDHEAKQQIIQITNELFSMGLLTATGGNISALASDGETMWITPSQMYKGGLTDADLVHIQTDGTVIEGTCRPSVECQMHAAAYRVRPGTHRRGAHARAGRHRLRHLQPGLPADQHRRRLPARYRHRPLVHAGLQGAWPTRSRRPCKRVAAPSCRTMVS